MKNKYEIRGDVTAIFVSSEKYGEYEFLIDTRFLKKVSEAVGTWGLLVSGEGSLKYAKGKDVETKKVILLHRLVTRAPIDKVVDHINHNTLDNRLENLRVVTHAENLQNRRGADRRNMSSGYRGVYWNKNLGKWNVQVRTNGVGYHIGCYTDLEEANKAAIEARKRLLPYSFEKEA